MAQRLNWQKRAFDLTARHRISNHGKIQMIRSKVLGPTVAYIDTVEFFFRYLPNGVRTKIEAVHGRSPWVTPCKDRFGNTVGYRIGLHQPKPAVLRVLAQFQQRDRGKSYRVDVAFDLTTHSRTWIEQHGLLRCRRPGPLHEEENALYWIE